MSDDDDKNLDNWDNWNRTKDIVDAGAKQQVDKRDKKTDDLEKSVWEHSNNKRRSYTFSKKARENYDRIFGSKDKLAREVSTMDNESED